MNSYEKQMEDYIIRVGDLEETAKAYRALIKSLKEENKELKDENTDLKEELKNVTIRNRRIPKTD